MNLDPSVDTLLGWIPPEKRDEARQRLQAIVRDQAAALEEANRRLDDARLAALNIMEDAVMARHRLELTQVAFDRSSDAAYWVLEDGGVCYANAAASEATGYSKDELLGLHISDIDEEMTRAGWPKERERIREQKIVSIERRHRRKDGSTFLVEVRINYLEFGETRMFCGFARDITARKLAEENLRASRQRLRSHIENSPMGVIEWDHEWNIVEWNASAERIFGYSRVDALGKNATLLISDPDCESLGKVLSDLSGQRGGNRSTNFNVTADGRTILCDWYNSILTDESGARTGVASMVMDITEANANKTALQKSEARYRLLFENMAAGFAVHEIICDARGRPADYRYLEVNPAFERLTGISAERAVGRTVRELIPDIELSWIDTYGRVALTGESAVVEDYAQALDKFFEVRAFQPAPNQFAVIFSDITERKRTEQAIQRSEAKYRQLFEQSADAFLVIKDGRFADCNQAAVDMLHYPDKAGVLGKQPAELSPPVQADGQSSSEKLAGLIQQMEHQKNLRFDWLHKRADGEIFPVDVSLTSLVDRAGDRILHVAWRDISELRQALNQLQRLSTAIEQSPETIVITDTDGHIQYANPAFERITGYSRQEVMGKSPNVLKSGVHDAAFYAKLWQTIQSGHVWEGRLVNRRKNGEIFTEEASISPVKDRNGNTINYVAIKRDISDELQREESLRQSQKMEAVGQLAGGVAHDFNNILQAILGFSELLLLTLGRDSQEFNNASEIKRSTRRAIELTRQLLAFSRKQPVDTHLLDLNHVVNDAEALISILLGDKYAIALDLAEELPEIFADTGQITQIIMNLALNARDAMPQGGRLAISTERVVFGNRDAAALPDGRAGTFACLSVSDNGCGIGKEIMEKIFEPFFTTKEVGKGTGLGLAVVYGIMKQSKGWINVYSEEGLGSCFKLYFPIPGADGKGAGPDGGRIGERASRILLVEDDESISAMVGEILVNAGYEVVAAATVEQALERYGAANAVYDLLLSDIVLPDGTGIELADRLRAAVPGIPVLLSSGYPDQLARWKDMGPKGYHFLHKPFTVSSLMSAVEKALAKQEQ